MEKALIGNRCRDRRAGDEPLGRMIGHTALLLKTELSREFRRQGLDITTEQWMVIIHLWDHEGQYQRELADHTLRDKPAITRIVDRLQKDGLVLRKTDESDRRIYKIYLTDKGRQLRNRLFEVACEFESRMLRGVKKDDIASLRRILSSIRKNLE